MISYILNLELKIVIFADFESKQSRFRRNSEGAEGSIKGARGGAARE
jgi:hypothetical protein